MIGQIRPHSDLGRYRAGRQIRTPNQKLEMLKKIDILIKFKLCAEFSNNFDIDFVAAD